MSEDLRVALVTGGGAGIGAAASARLANGLFDVVIVGDVDIDAAEQTAETVMRNGAQGLACPLDVSREGAWDEVVSEISSRFGRLDALVNNAGISRVQGLEEESLEGWERVVAVSQRGVWLGMKHCCPLVRQAGGGSVVNVSSIYSTVGGFGGSVAYHAAKGAVRAMTKNAALAWAADNIRVNSVHPGFVATGAFVAHDHGAEYVQQRVSRTPLGRLGSPEEVAAVIAFLAGSESTFMTGSEVYVDGGYTAV